MIMQSCFACGDSHLCPGSAIPAPVQSPVTGSVASFVGEACVVDEGLSIGGGRLYGAYVAWCEEGEMRPTWNNAFSKTIQALGFTRRLSGTTTYYGLDVRAV
jgi:hypothetical protein